MRDYPALHLDTKNNALIAVVQAQFTLGKHIQNMDEKVIDEQATYCLTRKGYVFYFCIIKQLIII